MLKPVNTFAHQDECRWNVNNSKMLIDLYGKYKDKVGSLKIKNLKKMWEIISEEMSLIYEMKIHPNNCENRWRVLERNYKKYFENKNGTGRGKKYFEFSEEMDKLFAHKKMSIQKFYFPLKMFMILLLMMKICFLVKWKVLQHPKVTHIN